MYRENGSSGFGLHILYIDVENLQKRVGLLEIDPISQALSTAVHRGLPELLDQLASVGGDNPLRGNVCSISCELYVGQPVLLRGWQKYSSARVAYPFRRFHGTTEKPMCPRQ